MAGCVHGLALSARTLVTREGPPRAFNPLALVLTLPPSPSFFSEPVHGLPLDGRSGESTKPDDSYVGLETPPSGKRPSWGPWLQGLRQWVSVAGLFSSAVTSFTWPPLFPSYLFLLLLSQAFLISLDGLSIEPFCGEGAVLPKGCFDPSRRAHKCRPPRFSDSTCQPTNGSW